MDSSSIDKKVRWVSNLLMGSYHFKKSVTTKSNNLGSDRFDDSVPALFYLSSDDLNMPYYRDLLFLP
jgi:hypothetical protein